MRAHLESEFPVGKAGQRYTDTVTQQGMDIHKKVSEWADAVITHGPVSDTQESYDRCFSLWVEYCRRRGLEPLYRGGDLSAFERTFLHFLAYDNFMYGNRAETLRARMRAVNKMHKVVGLGNPFEEAHSLRIFCAHVEKLQPPAKPKFPYPAPLLQGLIQRLQADTHNNLNMKAALTTGFNYFLRSREYLKVPGKKGQDKPVALRWGHILFLNEACLENGPSIRQSLSGKEVAEADRILVDVLSTKDRLGDATRDSPMTGTDLCAVSALKKLYLHICQSEGKAPAEDRIVFLEDNGQPLSRAKVNSTLQENLEFFGLSSELSGRFASHSLRRGGACAYIAAGMDPLVVKKIGRWLGDKWHETYVNLSSMDLRGTIFDAQTNMVHYNRN